MSHILMSKHVCYIISLWSEKKQETVCRTK